MDKLSNKNIYIKFISISVKMVALRIVQYVGRSIATSKNVAYPFVFSEKLGKYACYK